MMRKRKKLSAYMTVEISLLFPIIVLLLVSILYLIFLEYNQVTAFQNAGITALYGKCFSYSGENKTELVGRMYDVLESLNDDQYLAISSIKQKVTIENNDIKVIQSIGMKTPFLSEEIMEEMKFSEKLVVDAKNYIFYVRQVRKVKEKND